MVASGALLFYAAPLARYENVFFRLKMAALVLALSQRLGVSPHDLSPGR